MEPDVGDEPGVDPNDERDSPARDAGDDIGRTHQEATKELDHWTVSVVPRARSVATAGPAPPTEYRLRHPFGWDVIGAVGDLAGQVGDPFLAADRPGPRAVFPWSGVHVFMFRPLSVVI